MLIFLDLDSHKPREKSSQLSEVIKSFRTQIQSMAISHEHAIAKLKAEHQIKVERLSEESRKYKFMHGLLQQKCEAAEQENLQKEVYFQDKFKLQRAEEVIRQLEGQIETMQWDIEHMKFEKRTIGQKVDMRSNEVRNLNIKLEAWQQQVNSQTKKLDYFKQRVEELEEEKLRFKAVKQKLEDQLQKSHLKLLILKEKLYKKDMDLRSSKEAFDVKCSHMMSRMIDIKSKMENGDE